jgi:hypothetical protein
MAKNIRQPTAAKGFWKKEEKKPVWRMIVCESILLCVK